MHNKPTGNETDAILKRLSWWGGVTDELASCPIEELQCVDGRVCFFVDAKLCEKQVLPGFATPAQQVGEMTLAEKHSLAVYLVRLHKERFACAARAVAGNTKTGSAEILVIGDEVEFTLSPRFIRQALEVYDE